MRSKRGVAWLGALVVVLALCVGAFLLARSIARGHSAQLRTVIQTPALDNQRVRVLNEGIAYYDGSTLHALNGKGKQIWSYAAGADAGFSVDSGGVATWKGGVLSILSSDKGLTLFSGSMEDTILNARAGKVFSAVQIGEEHNSSIVILESSGRQVEKIGLANQTVLDFGFFNNDALFWLMSLNTEGTVPVCTISTYRPGKLLAGTIEDNQQVLYEVLFQSSQIRAVGTTHIKDFDYTGKEIEANRILVYGWYLMSLDDQAANPMMAFVPVDQSDGAGGISDVRMIRGQLEQSVRLPYPAKRVVASGDAIYAFTGQYVMVCHMGDTVPTTYALPVYVDEILDLTKGRNCVTTSGGRVCMIPLP